MADAPDPTRRLRPLVEARQRRQPTGDEPVDGVVASGVRAAAPGRSAHEGDDEADRLIGGQPRLVPQEGAAAGRGQDRLPDRGSGPVGWVPDWDGGSVHPFGAAGDEKPGWGEPVDEATVRGDVGPGRGGRRWQSWRPWTRWRERWVPGAPGVRVDPGRRGGALISTIAIAAVVVAALGFFRDDGTVVGPSTVAVVDGGSALSSAASSGASDTGDVPPPAMSSSTAEIPLVAGEIVVAVTGSVRQPGVVTLPAGARVADAIAAAGGIVDGTDYTGLNLAAKLADGDSVVVGGNGQGLTSGGGGGTATGGATDATSGTPGLVDLNGADRTALETLPGVGPVMAGNIMAWRDTNGGFDSVAQLQEITGIGPARFATLAPLVRVG